jgi:hypothetical protein
MKFFRGLHIDHHPSEQPENSYRQARNLVAKPERGALTNEPGSEEYTEFPAGYFPIGKAVIPDGRIIVFLAGGEGESEIGVIHPDYRYETLANDPRLDFRLDRPIHATVRRAFNVTKSQQFSSEVMVPFSPEMLHISEDTQVDVETISPSPS